MLIILVYSNKHSSFSSSFPIYLFTQRTEEVPDEDATEAEAPETPASDSEESDASSEAADPEETKEASETDEDEAIVEDVDGDEEKKEEAPPPKMKSVVVDEWSQLNAQAPLWMRYVEISTVAVLAS